MQQQKEKPFQSGNVLVVSISHLVHDVYSAFLAPVLPLLIAKFNLSLGMAGALSFIGRAPSLLNPLVGMLADRLSVRYFIIISPSVTAVSMSLLGVAPGYVSLALLCFIMGVSATLFHVPAPVMIKETAGNRVGKGMSFYMAGGEAARTLGPLVILSGVSLWGLEGTYRLVPFGLAASLILYFRVRNIRVSGETRRTDKTAGIKDTLRLYRPFLVILVGITLFRAFMRAALSTYLPTFMNLEKGESLWVSGISLSIVQLAGTVGTFFGGSLSDKIGRKTTLLIMCIGAPVSMILFMLGDGILVIPLLALIGFFLIANTPVILALVQDLNSDRPAFMNSLYMTISFFLGAVAILLVGMLGDRIGLEKTFWICGLLGFGAIPFIIKLKPPTT